MRDYVTKTFLFLLLLISIGCTKNTKTVWVLDGEHILTEKQILKFDSLFKSHEKITSNEMALVTTPGYGSDTSIFYFALHFGRSMGIGKEGKNNGILITFSGANKEVDISTGYGTEKVLKDELAKQIIDSIMIPRFKEGKEYEGLWNGCKAITDFLEKPENKIP